MPHAPRIHVTHHPVPGRFLAEVDGHQAHVDYEMAGDTMRITHTRVPSEIGGRGIAGDLTRTALDHARKEGWKVEAVCSYAQDWLRKHPEYSDLTA